MPNRLRIRKRQPNKLVTWALLSLVIFLLLILLEMLFLR